MPTLELGEIVAQGCGSCPTSIVNLVRRESYLEALSVTLGSREWSGCWSGQIEGFDIIVDTSYPAEAMPLQVTKGTPKTRGTRTPVRDKSGCQATRKDKPDLARKWGRVGRPWSPFNG